MPRRLCRKLRHAYQDLLIGMMPTCNRVRNSSRGSVDWEICQTQFSEGLLEDFLHPRHQVRNKLDARGQITSSSSFTLDCHRSPDAWALGIWDSLRPDADEACCFYLLGIQQEPSKSGASGSVTSGSLVETVKCNLSPHAWLGFS